MTKVLLTCPPMIGMEKEFRPLWQQHGIDVHIPAFTQVMAEADLIDLVPEFDGWIIGDDPATRAVFEAGRKGRLRAAVKWGVGVDNVDFDACRDLGIPITNTPGVFGREVADVAMTYVLGLARETFMIDREIRQNFSWPKPCGISLWNKTAVVVGLGDIGRQTVKRLLAHDLDVLAVDPACALGETVAGARIVSFADALPEADFLIFTAPLNAATHHMFNASAVAAVKPGVRVVNVGRGPVVDEAALIEGLQSGRIYSAALDVFEIEPLPETSPLRAMDKCIFGSHNSSNTIDAVRHVSELAIEKLTGFLGAA